MESISLIFRSASDTRNRKQSKFECKRLLSNEMTNSAGLLIAFFPVLDRVDGGLERLVLDIAGQTH